MAGGEWLSIHEPILPADGLMCCRLKQIDSPAERKSEREIEGGGCTVQRVPPHACALCTSIVHAK